MWSTFCLLFQVVVRANQVLKCLYQEDYADSRAITKSLILCILVYKCSIKQQFNWIGLLFNLSTFELEQPKMQSNVT